jgi:hypothetical protein
MTTRLLSRDELHATFTPPARDVTGTEEELVDPWEYVDSIPLPPLDIVVLGEIARIYRDGTSRYQHLLVWTDRETRYLDIVIDSETGSILGHHVLELDDALPN